MVCAASKPLVLIVQVRRMSPILLAAARSMPARVVYETGKQQSEPEKAPGAAFGNVF